VASLRVVSGQLAATTIGITDELLIGRDDAGLKLDDPEVSHRHAIVRAVGDLLEIEDLGSANGTFVDGVQIDTPTVIGDGARVTVGTTEMVVEAARAGASMTSVSPDPQATSLAAAWEHDPELSRGRGPAPLSSSGPPPRAGDKSNRGRPFGRSGLASRRFISIAAAFAIVAGIGLAVYLLTSETSEAKASVIDVPIRFTVQDVNRSVLPCKASGSTYELVGRLVAPASSASSSVTVYTSGVIFSSFFEFTNKVVPGYDFAHELARLGQTSVVVDRVGYGKTVPYPSDGRSVCMGAQADMLHQVVSALRSGGYDVTGSSEEKPRTFDRVAVAGYSIAGMISELEAASFGDVNGVIAIGWAHQGFTEYGAGPDYIKAHCSPGLRKRPSGLTGYFRTLSPEKVPPLVSPQADQRIVATFWTQQEMDACGQFISALPMFFGMQKQVLAQIKVPVLVIFGWYDVLFKHEAWPAEWAHFKASRDRTLVGIPDGQMLMLDHHAPMTRRVIAAWLDDHGL